MTKPVKETITNKRNIPTKTSGNRIQDPPRECGDYQSSQVPGKLLKKTATSQSWTNTTISPRNMATCTHLANSWNPTPFPPTPNSNETMSNIQYYQLIKNKPCSNFKAATTETKDEEPASAVVVANSAVAQ